MKTRKQQTVSDSKPHALPLAPMAPPDLDMEQAARVFKALGHPARLTMVAALASGERCVCELTQLVGLDVSTVSKHLAVLKGCGVVSGRREGTWMHYRLEMACVPSFLRCMQTFLHSSTC